MSKANEFIFLAVSLSFICMFFAQYNKQIELGLYVVALLLSGTAALVAIARLIQNILNK